MRLNKVRRHQRQKEKARDSEEDSLSSVAGAVSTVYPPSPGNTFGFTLKSIIHLVKPHFAQAEMCINFSKHT
ncbi:hypothetical protein AOLI_G00294620 [Acnodon oligacanthus]